MGEYRLKKKKNASFLHLLILSLFILISVAILFLLKKLGIFFFIKQLFRALLPFFLGVLLAVILEPIAKFFSKKLPPLVSCVLPFFLLFSVMILLAIFLFPPFIEEGGKLLQTLPNLLEQMKLFLGKIFSFPPMEPLRFKVFAFLDQIPTALSSFWVHSCPHFCTCCIDVCITLFFSFLIGFYLLYDASQIKRFLKTHLPKPYRSETLCMFSSLKVSLSRYLLGLLLVMSLVFVTQFIGLSLAHMKSPLFFASLCAITDLIPYVGPYLGGIPTVLVAFSIRPTVGISVLFSILIVQLLENSFYQPYIMGKTLLLPPWLILTGIAFFSHFFGVLGMVLATPILLFLKTFIPYIRTCMKKKRKQ